MRTRLAGAAGFEHATGGTKSREPTDWARHNAFREPQESADFLILAERAVGSKQKSVRNPGSWVSLSLWGDRKSVVEGKSVLVRVDHGGRRLIINTQTYYNYTVRE